MIAQFAPMEHKEQVRIAVSKALSRILGSVNFSEGSHFQLIEALILLLNDEQPDIRYYLCEAHGINALIEGDKQGKWLVMGHNVQLNDQVVVEYLFEEFTQRILKEGNPALLKAYAEDFLYREWIVGNPYREHLAKNFEDKIFFFEPVNKFYDLLWVKRLAYRQLQAIKKASPGLQLGGTAELAEVDTRLNEYYSSVNILRHNSIQLEELVQDLIVAKLHGKEIACP